MDMEGMYYMTVEFKRRGMQSMAVLLLLLAAGTVAAGETQILTYSADISTARTAGIIGTLNIMEAEAMSQVSVKDTDIVLVAAAEDIAEQMSADTMEAAADPWNRRLMANVESSLYVRDGAGEQCGIVGKMYRGSVAEIIGHENGWTQISSGNVTGYVKDEYCVTGSSAYQLASSICETKATVKVSGLRIRQNASQEAGVLKGAAQGEKLTVDLSAPAAEGWVAVKIGKSTGYVSAQYVDVAVEYGTALTIEEEQALIAAQKAAEEQAAREAAQKQQAQRTQNAAVAASYDDVTLLAALIQCEAGGDSYEGKLAVGAVVMNRLRSGYSDSIYGVIYQKGQFTPAGSGKLAKVAASGPSSSCIQAAQEALSGVDNTGGAKNFRRASSGRAGVVIGHHVFF